MAEKFVDWSRLGADLLQLAEVNLPIVDQALTWLAGLAPHTTLALDVGSGPGVAAVRLAELLPDAEVVAADGAEPLLEMARERAERAGVSKRFTTTTAELPDGLDQLPAADLVWVSGVVHHLDDPAAGVAGLARLVRPGGVLALREGGLPQRFLPPHADGGLSARLNVLNDEHALGHDNPLGQRDAPRSWPQLLREAGLRAYSKSFLLDFPEPLASTPRLQLRRALARMAEAYDAFLSAADRRRLAELTADDGPESVLVRPDVFLLRVSTVHAGVR